MNDEQLALPDFLSPATVYEVKEAMDKYQIDADEVVRVGLVATSLFVPLYRRVTPDFSEHNCALMLLALSSGFRGGTELVRQTWETCKSMWKRVGRADEEG